MFSGLLLVLRSPLWLGKFLGLLLPLCPTPLYLFFECTTKFPVVRVSNSGGRFNSVSSICGIVFKSALRALICSSVGFSPVVCAFPRCASCFDSSLHLSRLFLCFSSSYLVPRCSRGFQFSVIFLLASSLEVRFFIVHFCDQCHRHGLFCSLSILSKRRMLRNYPWGPTTGGCSKTQKTANGSQSHKKLRAGRKIQSKPSVKEQEPNTGCSHLPTETLLKWGCSLRAQNSRLPSCLRTP
jgi:hypothetical protein